jgi:hypothetical protein
MSRSHAKHLEPKKYRERSNRVEDQHGLKRVAKSHKQKRVNDRAKLRKEFL